MRNIIPILLIAVSLGLFYLHIDPRYQDVKNLMDERTQYKEALKKADELQVVRDELLNKYNTLPKDDLAKLERLIPTNLNTVKLVTDISGIAGPYGIAIRGVKVREGVTQSDQSVVGNLEKRPYEATNIVFRFSATYRNLVGFLKDLEKSLQLVDVKSVSFSSETEGSSNIYDYDVTIQTYWLQ